MQKELLRLGINFHRGRVRAGSSPDLEASLVLAAMMAGCGYVEKHYDAGKERLGKEGIGLGKEGDIQEWRINVQ